MKKFLGLTVAGAVALSALVAMAQGDNKVIVNGNEIAADYIVNEAGDKMIPLRGVCEELGFEVNWIEESRAIEIVKMPIFITCSPDFDGYAFSRMAHQPLGTAPILVDGTTYVPASFVSDILGGTIDTSNDIAITYGQEKEEGETAPEEAAPIASVYATEIGEDSLTVMDFVYGEVIVNVTEDTQIVDSEGKAIKLSDIDTSMQLNVTYGETMTMSLPPMTTASKIEVTGELAKVIKEGSVSEVVAEEGTVTQIILGENEVALNVAEETIIKDADGNVKSLADIKEGTVLRARTNGMATMSIPAQMPTLEIIIFE
ncbi:MAG: hypothetical protein IKB93_02620 [Clostridia bacterium]|nr:hypothetical protein [Clostridia bacterium]